MEILPAGTVGQPSTQDYAIKEGNSVSMDGPPASAEDPLIVNAARSLTNKQAIDEVDLPSGGITLPAEEEPQVTVEPLSVKTNLQLRVDDNEKGDDTDSLFGDDASNYSNLAIIDPDDDITLPTNDTSTSGEDPPADVEVSAVGKVSTPTVNDTEWKKPYQPFDWVSFKNSGLFDTHDSSHGIIQSTEAEDKQPDSNSQADAAVTVNNHDSQFRLHDIDDAEWEALLDEFDPDPVMRARMRDSPKLDAIT